MTTLLLLITLFVCLLSSAMIIALDGLSLNHLKLWAKKKDQISSKLFPLKAQASLTRLTLEFIRALSMSIGLIMVSRHFHFLVSLIIIFVLVFGLFAFVTRIYLKPLGIRLLAALSTQILTISKMLRPILMPLSNLLEKTLGLEPIVLTRADMKTMLEGIEPNDTDISNQEIEIMKHTLDFASKDVHMVMTPNKVVTSVKVDETLSPVLIDELYKSGHSRFPVYSSDSKEIVGILFLHDLVDLKAQGMVKDHMKKKVYFVHEDRELDHVLQAFLKTKQHMFMVVNSFAEIVGVVTIEDIFEQIIGHPIIDEFDRYDDMRAVAEEQAKKHRIQNKEKMVE